MREIVLDTETTGLSPKSGHRIVEIGCVELYNHLPTGKVFHKYINPERDVPQEAYQVHGLSQDFLKDHPVMKDVIDEFIDFIQGDPLVIHNAGFDMKFLNAELEWANKTIIPMDRAVDTLHMARRKFPGSPASLDALCRRFQVDNTNREKHGALLDSYLLADVYLHLIGGRQPDLVLAKDEEKSTQSTSQQAQDRKGRPQREWAINQQDKEAHEKFLESVKDPLWKKTG